LAKATFVIVGAGVAAASAADTLRSKGFDGRVVLVGQEADPPYNRPTLSKERLRNEISDEQTLFHSADDYRKNEIELLLEREVRRVNVADRTIHFGDDGSTLAYDSVLIATGAHLRHLHAPGEELAGVYYLRSLRDARALSQTLAHRPRVLVAGNGFIGCEVAASARTMGCEVTLLGNTAPLVRALGAEIAALYAQYHRGEGVDVRIGTFVERFEGKGRLERAVLVDGSSVECDVAVIGIGVEPSLDVLRNEPVEIGEGILVDEFCRTSAPRVFAAGDVAFSWNPRFAKRIRVEHFYNARNQAVAAAKAMLGPADPYNPIPYFWSDQYSFSLWYRGYASEWDSVVFRGNTEGGSFSAFYVKDGETLAVCSVNRTQENFAAQRLLGKRIEPRLLADDGLDVKEIPAS
jgi:3-phenylpropionate/trans-cinnamate dioxygenase ferredoxin reductase component